MKKFLAAIPLLLLAGLVMGQQLSQVSFSGGSKLTSFAILTDQDVLIRISEEGKILEWGIEVQSQRFNQYAPKLQPFMGRVDYYGAEADSVSQGKLKSIGTTVFTYYGPQEMPIKVGKLKSVGTLQLDYYTHFDNAAFKGKIRFCGSLVIEYFSSFADEASRGKLKSVGSTAIVYHSIFDDRLIRGKIKSIGNVNYGWYTSLDRKDLQDGMKTGSLRQQISGITYILR